MAIYSSSAMANTVWSASSLNTVVIPEEYRISGITISGHASISGGNNPGPDATLNRSIAIYWKDKDGVEHVLKSGSGYYSSTIDLTDTTLFKFRVSGSKSYSGTGIANYGASASGTVYFNGDVTLPWGSITTETFITADKLNSASTILDANVSVTAGTLITRAPWQTVGDKKNIVFDNTKPLLQDLQNLVDVSPGVWGSDPY